MAKRDEVTNPVPMTALLALSEVAFSNLKRIRNSVLVSEVNVLLIR